MYQGYWNMLMDPNCTDKAYTKKSHRYILNLQFLMMHTMAPGECILYFGYNVCVCVGVENVHPSNYVHVCACA